ncbi:MAG: c-type cytochrome, partial [Salinimicrobium sp.]
IIGFHLFLVLKNGISEPTKPGKLVDPKTYREWYSKMLKKKGVPFFPDVIWRDMVFSVGVLVVIILLAWFVGAPEITKPADPTILKTEPTPDWYFKWIYAIFATMNKFLEPYFLFFGPLLGIILLFSIPFLSRGGERSPMRRPWAIAGVILTIVMVGSLTYAGLNADWVPAFDVEAPENYTTIPADNDDPIVKQGEQLFYDVKCAYCHTMGKTGGKKGPELTHVAQRLNKKQIMAQIANGGLDMPAYGATLTSGELHALVEFLSVERWKETASSKK